MFINNVHILMYVLFGILGSLVGFFSGWCNARLPERQKVLSKDIIIEYKTKLKPNYILMITGAILYILLLYRFEWQTELIMNIQLISYMILVPMLLSVFCIDYKLTIIPNRLNLTIFEIGLIFTFIFGLLNFNLAKDSIFGMFVGGGIFLAISIIGRLIAGKEAMGFGDVKLMGALGLFFGMQNTIVITVISFLIGAIVSIVIIIAKRSTKQYIPFGPFIVISTFITMLVPGNILVSGLIKIFTLGMM